MQSLKIIIFRDTDKPYTMIISSGVLVGLAFSIIALMSLFTFSVMSNIMFYDAGQQGPAMPSQAGIIEQTEKGSESSDEDDSMDNLAGQTEDNISGENDEYDGSLADAEAGQTENLDDSEELNTEDVPSSFNDNTIDSNVNVGGGIAAYMPADSEVEAFLLQDATIGSNSIRIRAQVQKRLSLGQNFRGRFCAALVDDEGNIGPTYPSQVVVEGIEVQNPERANTFRIAYRRNYEIPFNGINPQNFSAVVLFIFDEQTKTLLWRNSVPLTR